MSVIVAVMIASAFIYKVYQDQAPELLTSIVYPKAKQLPSFELTDQRGQPFTNQQLEGKWTVLFFGYTFCPDICPTTMLALSQVANQLAPEIKNQTQFIFCECRSRTRFN